MELAQHCPPEEAVVARRAPRVGLEWHHSAQGERHLALWGPGRLEHQPFYLQDDAVKCRAWYLIKPRYESP